MFGFRFKSWMETHIVRSRKKGHERNKEGHGKSKPSGKESSERSLFDSLGNSLANRFHTSKDGGSHTKHHGHHHGHQSSSSDKRMDSMALSSQYSQGPSLSSPESAYSTGYSTDGTSPGASFPPEYYINIRTGTHYFHSGGAAPASLAIPSAVPSSKARNVRVVFCDEVQTKCIRSEKCVRINEEMESVASGPAQGIQLSGPSFFLRTDTHRRTGSCGESHIYPTPVLPNFSNVEDICPSNNYIMPSSHSIMNASSTYNPIQAAASPRQRNRIRTNPWLTSNNMSSSNSSIIGTSSLSSTNGTSKSGLSNGFIESFSSCSSGSESKPHSHVQKGMCSYGSASDVTLSRIVKHHCEIHVQSTDNLNKNLTESPNRRFHTGWNTSMENRNTTPGIASPNMQRCNSVCSSTSSSSNTAQNYTDSTVSDDDLTLNEMLGKYDESYVYEKETDILSDSDPTDCEDYYDDTDADTGRDGGDEQDSRDDMDFIDNGSLLEYDPLPIIDSEKFTPSSPVRLINRGHCTYFVSPNGSDPSKKTFTNSRESALRRSISRRRNEETDDLKPFSHRLSIRKSGEDSPIQLIRRNSKTGRRYKRHKEQQKSNICSNQVSHGGAKALSERKKRVMHKSCCNKDKNNSSQLNKTINSNGYEISQALENDFLPNERLNINQILMSKVFHHISDKGSRSAGNTPLPLRRRIINGNAFSGPNKNLSLFVNTSNEVDTKDIGHAKKCIYDKEIHVSESQMSPNIGDKKRSYSVSYAVKNENLQPPAELKSLSSYSSEVALIEADKEAHQKYKELILEAENILVSMKENKTLSENFSPKRKLQSPSLQRSNNVNHNNIFSEPQEIPRLDDRNKNLKISLLKSRLMNSPKRYAEKRENLGVKENVFPFEKVQPNSQNSSPAKHINKKETMPLPKIKVEIVDEIHQKKNTGSSSSDSDNSSISKPQQVQPALKDPTQVPTSKRIREERPPLVTFQSIDLGHSLEVSSYCPQSEPVKRKVYACSATFDKLQKTLEKRHNASLRYKGESREHKGNLKEKLELLRLERLRVESKVREAREDEHKRLTEDEDYQKHLSVLRRQMLVHTIEGLKRSLEDQSAKLKETYNVSPDSEQTHHSKQGTKICHNTCEQDPLTTLI